MPKTVEDGMVAVITTDMTGAGWFSWNNDYPILLFHPKLVAMIRNGYQEQITRQWVKENIGLDIEIIPRSFKINWIPEKKLFKVNEKFGEESIEIILLGNIIVA